MTPEDFGKYALVTVGAVASTMAAWRLVARRKEPPTWPGVIVLAFGLAGMGTGTYGIPFLGAEIEFLKELRKLMAAGPKADVAASLEAIRANRIAPEHARILLTVAREQAPDAFAKALNPSPEVLPSLPGPGVKPPSPEVTKVLSDFARIAATDLRFRAELKAGQVQPDDLLLKWGLAAHAALPMASPIS